ncbi:MAG: phosphate ABC transporter permease family protein, partial [Woeseiaceae bacterium]|nr:phosphate ABC transporter permease family protein [Woeseiaceae bacterium]
MQSFTLILLLGFAAIAAFYVGRRRSLELVGGPGKGRALHSLPGYYGHFVAISCVLPALAMLLAWVLVEPKVITALVVSGLPNDLQELSSGELDLLINNIRNLASGDVVSVAIDDNTQRAADQFNG